LRKGQGIWFAERKGKNREPPELSAKWQPVNAATTLPPSELTQLICLMRSTEARTAIVKYDRSHRFTLPESPLLINRHQQISPRLPRQDWSNIAP